MSEDTFVVLRDDLQNRDRNEIKFSNLFFLGKYLIDHNKLILLNYKGLLG